MRTLTGLTYAAVPIYMILELRPFCGHFVTSNIIQGTHLTISNNDCKLVFIKFSFYFLQSQKTESPTIIFALIDCPFFRLYRTVFRIDIVFFLQSNAIGRDHLQVPDVSNRCACRGSFSSGFRYLLLRMWVFGSGDRVF